MLRKDIQEAIERLWPDGVVEMTVDYEDSWFLKVRPKLRRAWKSLEGAQLLFERKAEGGPVWWPDSDPEEDPPDDFERHRSYHLYFIAPEREAFEFTTESEDYVADENGGEPSLGTIRGAGRSGYCVAVCLLAPFAAIAFGERIECDNGDTTEPSIELPLETIEGDSIDPERHFRETAAGEAFSRLAALRRKISEVLRKHGVTVLAEEEWKKRAPGLRVGEGVLAEEPLRVLDALFFEEL